MSRGGHSRATVVGRWYPLAGVVLRPRGPVRAKPVKVFARTAPLWLPVQASPDTVPRHPPGTHYQDHRERHPHTPATLQRHQRASPRRCLHQGLPHATRVRFAAQTRSRRTRAQNPMPELTGSRPMEVRPSKSGHPDQEGTPDRRAQVPTPSSGSLG